MKIVAENRKARFNYFIESEIEAGIMLTGSEVKSLRAGRSSIAESYASTEGGELWLINAHIPEFGPANRFNHEPLRKRKLLVNKRELSKLFGATERSGYTIVPLKMYFNDRGICKVQLGLGRGKKLHDKRETDKKRDWQKDKARLMRARG